MVPTSSQSQNELPLARPMIAGREAEGEGYEEVLESHGSIVAPSGCGWPIEPTSARSRRKGRLAVQSITARALRAAPGIWLMW